MFGINEKTESKPQYAEAITMVHKEFLTAGDKLYESALRFINEPLKVNKEKIGRLKKLGFTLTKEVVLTEKSLAKEAESETILNRIKYYRDKYPLYKFITEEKIQTICEKYGLIYGDVSSYKGFVPDKNLKDMELFHVDQEDIDEIYTSGLTGWMDMTLLYGWGQRNIGNTPLPAPTPEIIKEKIPAFYIAAPQKDFDTSDKEIKKFKLQPIPDPVVMCKVRNGYLIITAWGDEASDPLIKNEIVN
jgi:hypothetical protein